METKRSIKFTVEKGTKRPKSINDPSTLFVLYAPERIKIHSGENKTVNMNFIVDWPPDILTTYLIIPYLKKEYLTLLDYHIINQTKLELFNKPHKTTFLIKKREETATLISFSKGIQKLNVKYKTFQNQIQYFSTKE